MPKCAPVDTNQVNQTKITDGWQVIKGYFGRFDQLLPKMQLCNMAEFRKRKSMWNPRCHLVAGEFSKRC